MVVLVRSLQKKPQWELVQVKANFTGVLAEIAKKAGAASAARTSERDVCGKLKAAISSIDAFGAEGSQAVSAEEVRPVMAHKPWMSNFSRLDESSSGSAGADLVYTFSQCMLWVQARKVDRRVKACQGLLSKATAEKAASSREQQQTQAWSHSA